MTRGRHRQSSPSATTLPMAAVGALAVCSAALATFGSDTRLLRLGVSCSLAAAVSTAALLRTRERELARELSVEASGRRLEQAESQEQITGLNGVVDKLNAEVVSLREELAEVTAAHAAALLVKTAPRRPAPLTREAFAEAAAALGEDPDESVATAPEPAVRPATGKAERRGLERFEMELRPIELATAAAVVKAAPKAEAAEPVAAEQPAAEAPAEAKPVNAEPVNAEPVNAEPVDAADSADPEHAQVIDLTAHDDTQPLRLAGVRRRA